MPTNPTPVATPAYTAKPMDPALDTPVGQSGKIDLNAPGTPAQPISIAGLQTPQSPMTVTPVPPATQSAGLASTIATNADAFTKNLDTAATTSKTAKDTSLGALVDALKGNQGQATLTDKAYAGTVDPAQADLKDINNQIITEQTSARHQIEALQKNPEGLFGTGLQDKINEIQKASTSKLADLSVIQMARQGKYDSAKQIADRAVAANLEQETNKLNTLQFIYNANKDQFTTDEQHQFETAQTDRKRVLDEKTAEQKARFDQMIKQNDPLYRAQLAALTPFNFTDTSPVATVTTADGAVPTLAHTLTAGEDPYVLAQQNGTDMATLQKLNPSITDWTKLPVGAKVNLPNTDASWLTGKSQPQIDAYNKLAPADRPIVKQLVNGDALLSDVVKSRGATSQGAIQKLVNEATAIDPNFSINANKQRFQYKEQFNNPNSKEQLQINAINTGLGHLAEFKTASDALGNKAFLPYNSLVNYLKTNTGDPAVSNLNTVITALAGELAAVYKGGTAPTDQETEQWRNTILASFAKQQAAGVASTTASLISNKMLALNNSYKNVMGSYPSAPIVNPDVLQQLHDAGVDISQITTRLQGQGYKVPMTPSTGSDDSVLSQFGL